MSIYVTKFVQLFNCEWFVSLSKSCFAACGVKLQPEFYSQKIVSYLRSAQ